jgi:hypothetical protein
LAEDSAAAAVDLVDSAAARRAAGEPQEVGNVAI